MFKTSLNKFKEIVEFYLLLKGLSITQWDVENLHAPRSFPNLQQR